MSARSVLTYRASYVLGYFGVVFQIGAMFALWRVLLEGGGLEGFTWDQMQAYLLVVFVTSALVGSLGDWSMASRILDGMVAVDLTRPMDYQYARFAETLGRCGVEAMTAGTVALGYVLVTDAALPASAQAAALFAVSLVVVVPLKFTVIYSSTLLCFWTQNYLGLMWARTALLTLLSGALVPLVFLPDWLQAVAAVLPFVGMTATPAGLYLGRLTGVEAAVALAAQIGWTIGLWLLARGAFARAVRQVTVNGG
jgi:ABC-2 type transport system permease protein